MGAFVPYGREAKSSARCFHARMTKTANVAEPKMKEFLQTTLKNFEAIQPKMDKHLADELAYFVTLLIKKWGDEDPGLDDIQNNALYREANSLLTQNIPYPLWFVLVSVFGPGHSALAEMRAALSKAWGSEIPSDEISYPTCDSSSREFELFGMDPKLKFHSQPTTMPSTPTTSDAPQDWESHPTADLMAASPDPTTPPITSAESFPSIQWAPAKICDVSQLIDTIKKSGKLRDPNWLSSTNRRLDAKIDGVQSEFNDGLVDLTSQVAYSREDIIKKFDQLKNNLSSLESSFDQYKDLPAQEGRELREFAKRLRLSLNKWKDSIKAFAEQTGTEMMNLKMQHDDQKSIAERLTKELQSTNAKLVDECEQRKTENVALQSRVDALENLCQEIIAKHNKMAHIVATEVARSQGYSVDNEEGDRETVDEASSSNLNKRTLPPNGSSGGAAKRRRCD